MDRGRHDLDIAGFVRQPQPWTDDYYAKLPRAERLSHIVDVPYFVDSAHAILVQTADLYAYILRRHVEIENMASRQRYVGESDLIGAWARCLAGRAPRGDLYPTTGRRPVHDLFREIAPPALVSLRA
jgi:hypothetical protein